MGTVTVALPRPEAHEIVLAVAFTAGDGGVLVTTTTMPREVLENAQLGEALAAAVRAGVQMGVQDVVMVEHAEAKPLDT